MSQSANGNNNTTTTIKRNKGPKENYYDQLGGKVIIGLGLIRCGIMLIWGIGILLATYHVYIESNRRTLDKDPKMNPGPFSSMLDRGRDISDVEWVLFSAMLWTKYIFVFGLSQACKGLFRLYGKDKFASWTSPIFSILLALDLCGGLAVMHFLAVPGIYWILMRFKRKCIIWGWSIALILHFKLIQAVIGKSDEAEKAVYYFCVATAWNICRGVSFCMDMWDRTENEIFSWTSFCNMYKYMFYMPTFLTGPIVVYEHFEKEVILQSSSCTKKGDLLELGKNLLRMFLITCLIELVYHTLYFRPLFFSPPRHVYMLSTWTICGIIYWLGQIFTLKYKVMYGFPSSFAEFDGMTMYPLPRCPAYIHRYSVLWKDFDRGLYTFMVKYIYKPMITIFHSCDPDSIINIEIKKLLSSFVTFVFVYIWHSLEFDVFLWAALNFLGITIEKIGSLLKKIVDILYRIHPVVWDSVIEPLVTIPLAMMSILNSSIFCGKYEPAKIIYEKLMHTWSPSYSYHSWIFFFMFCFTQTAVTIRTWTPFTNSIRKRWNENPRNRFEPEQMHLD